MLDLDAHGRANHDARIGGEELHRHVRPPRGSRVRPLLVRLDVLRLWFAEECFWEGVEI